MARKKLPAPEDDYDREILGDIRRVGWSVIAIHEEGGQEWPYTFSVGLFHTFGQPEILFAGLEPRQAGDLTNIIGDAMRAGVEFIPGARWEQMQGLPLYFVAVGKDRYEEYVGYARWLYGGSDFPLLQCVCPDEQGRFPWEQGYDITALPKQFLLGKQ